MKLLRALSHTAERIYIGGENKVDALFYYQLLLPLTDPEKGDVPGDARVAYYTKVETNTNTYAFRDLKLGGTYGHKFTSVSAAVCVDAVYIID